VERRPGERHGLRTRLLEPAGLDLRVDYLRAAKPRLDGQLTMGQWQRVLFAELDGPRKRGLVLQVLALA
jgi:hypothetical protein